MICVGFLCCGRFNFTKQTINSLLEKNPEFKEYQWFVFDNLPAETSNREFIEATIPNLIYLSSNKNIGIARATSCLMELAQADQDKYPYTLYLQNDWKCLKSDFLNPTIEVSKTYPHAYIKLSTKASWHVPHGVTNRPQIPGKIPIYTYKDYQFYIFQHGHFSMNPFLIPTELLSLIFPATCEKHAQENFMLNQLQRIDILPELAPFIHLGNTEKYRTNGWLR